MGRFNKVTKEFDIVKVSVQENNLNSIKVGEELRVLGNMVVRENSPVKNINCFKGESKVGLAASGSKVLILGKPEIKELGNYSEYWAKVELLD